MRLSDFDYALPEALIARYPPEVRGESRLLHLDRSTGQTEDLQFRDFPHRLRAGDVLVLNDSRVMRARLAAQKASGGQVELLLVEPATPGPDDPPHVFRAMCRPSRRLRPGQRLQVGAAEVQLLRSESDGFWCLGFEEDPVALAERVGHLPLPPYLHRDDEPTDTSRYQTVYADPEGLGSVAAPTAGLHFTEAMLQTLRARGVAIESIRLHVGPGTFLPVRTEDVAAHRMHEERFEVRPDTLERLRRAKAEGRRVLAVGTTVTRVLEALGEDWDGAPGAVRWDEGREGRCGRTAIFLRPGHRFAVVDGLLTNFHLPKSTLIMLVCAFAGMEATLRAYRHAVSENYRFFSYGDAMWIDGGVSQ